MPLTRKTVMISSTARDLPKHREEVMNACLSQGMFPVMMEHLPANDDDAISASLKMVDDADIYVGIYAQRYGYIPKGKKRNPKQVSITEMEYDRAVKRGIPRLIFVMDKAHPITIDDIDLENAAKLQKFKDRVQAKSIVNFFKSPAELRGQVVNSLSKQIESTPVTLPDTESSTIDVTAYFNALRKRYNVLALEGLTPPQKEEYLQIQLRSVFVEQSVREDTPPVELPKEVWEKLSREQEIHDEDLPSGITLDDVRKARDSYYQKPSRLVLNALTDSRCQYAIILGDPGSGKSTLARYVMLSLIDPLLAGDKIQKAFDGYLPLLIELRTFAGLCAENKCETPLEFLEHLGKTEGWGLTQSALHNQLKNDGRAVVIFDGLDEIFEPKLRETITNQIVGFTNAYPKARVIVTSRLLGYRRKILSDAGFTHFTLQDLNEKQVEAFITKWYQLAMSDRLDEAKERSERILKSFKDSASIRQLAGNPMLLTIMAIIGKHQELPRERWKLYDHAASVLIQHWDVNKHLKDENLEADFIGEDDKKELLRRLAYRMQSGDGGLAGNYIHREALQDEFESYLKERYNQTPAQAKLIADAMIQQFRERNFILSLYGANVFGFVHRAFLEYFCAFAFVLKFEKTKELTIGQLKTDVYEKHLPDTSWREVLRLICGMIDEKFSTNLVEHLLSIKEKRLAAECLREIRNRQLVLETIRLVLESFLSDVEMVERDGRRGLLTNIEVLEREFYLYGEYIEYLFGWPDQIWILDWFEKIKLKEIISPLTIGFFLGAIGGKTLHVRKALMNCLETEVNAIRIVAAIALAMNRVNTPLAMEVLCTISTDGDSEVVRYSANYALAAYFNKEPQIFQILTNSAVNDTSYYVRSSVVHLIGYFFRNSKTLSLLFDRALNDDEYSVRSSAINRLGEDFQDNIQTLPFLRERAVNDESPKPDDKKEVSWQGYVRDTAIEAIAEHWPDHPETLPLLRDRAKNDPTPWLRKRAKELIKKIEGKKDSQK